MRYMITAAAVRGGSRRTLPVDQTSETVSKKKWVFTEKSELMILARPN